MITSNVGDNLQLKIQKVLSDEVQMMGAGGMGGIDTQKLEMLGRKITDGGSGVEEESNKKRNDEEMMAKIEEYAVKNDEHIVKVFAGSQ